MKMNLEELRREAAFKMTGELDIDISIVKAVISVYGLVSEVGQGKTADRYCIPFSLDGVSCCLEFTNRGYLGISVSCQYYDVKKIAFKLRIIERVVLDYIIDCIVISDDD